MTAAPLRRQARDIAARAASALCFGLLSGAAFAALLGTARHIETASLRLGTAAELLANLFICVRLMMETCLLVLRPRAIAAGVGIGPKLAALLGTWLMGLTVFLPVRAALPAWLSLLSLGFSIGGSVLAMVVLRHLGRSMSIMAEARTLVTTGPFAAVRHPLYLAEEIGLLSMVLTRLGAAAVCLFAAQLACQVWRARNEERVLAATFPEYRGYADRTPMFLPLRGPRRRKYGAAGKRPTAALPIHDDG